MKKYFLIPLIFLFLFSISYADVSVDSALPERVNINETFNVNVLIETSRNKLEFSQMIPENWEIINWEVLGTDEFQTEERKVEFLGKNREVMLWSFRNIDSEEIIIKYEVKPEVLEEGDYEIMSVWIHEEGFDSVTETISISSEARLITDFEERDNKIIYILLGGFALVVLIFFIFKKYKESGTNFLKISKIFPDNKDLKSKIKKFKPKNKEEKKKEKINKDESKNKEKESKKKDKESDEFLEENLEKLKNLEKELKEEIEK